MNSPAIRYWKTRSPRRGSVFGTAFHLEDRVLFNVAPVEATLTGHIVDLPVPHTETPSTTTNEHFPGCNCGECQKLLMQSPEGGTLTAYALPPYFESAESRPLE